MFASMKYSGVQTKPSQIPTPEQTKCIAYEQASYICSDQNCEAINPYICAYEECKCFKHHPECKQMRVPVFFKKVNASKLEIIKARNQLQNKIDQIFNSIIDYLSDEREAIITRIKQGEADDYFQSSLFEPMNFQTIKWQNSSGVIISKALEQMNRQKKEQGMKEEIVEEIIEKMESQLNKFIGDEVFTFSQSIWEIVFKDNNELVLERGLNEVRPRVNYDRKESSRVKQGLSRYKDERNIERNGTRLEGTLNRQSVKKKY